jgi:hypothetical protein
MIATATPLWRPTPERIRSARITDYRAWLASARGVHCMDYDALWQWSTTELSAFWESIWDYFGVAGTRGSQPALATDAMPGAVWCPGASLYDTDQVFRHATAARPAIVAGDEDCALAQISWAELSEPAQPPPPPKRPAHYLWAVLIARIYEVFPLICPICGGPMRITSLHHPQRRHPAHSRPHRGGIRATPYHPGTRAAAVG